jgi:hypothetical protein
MEVIRFIGELYLQRYAGLLFSPEDGGDMFLQNVG